MVGLIQKVLLDLVESAGGVEAVLEVKRRAEVPADKTFHLDVAYSDDEFRRLLSAACDVLKITPQQACVAYADAFGRDALARFPTWFAMCKTGRQFLEKQPLIHSAFATGLADPASRKAVTDKFQVTSVGEELVTRYRSPNRLCALYKTLAQWMLDHTATGPRSTSRVACCAETMSARYISAGNPTRRRGMAIDALDTPASDRLRTAIDGIADQLCLSVGDNFDVTVSVDCDDEAVQKLQMLINFVLDTARCSLASVEEREALQRAIFEFAAEGFVTIDDRGIVEAFNAAAAKIFGYAPEEVIGRNISMLMPSPDREAHDEYLQSYLRTGKAQMIGHYRKLEAIRANGDRVTIGLAVSEARTSDRRRFTGIVRDLTEQKSNETFQIEHARHAALMAEIGVALTQEGNQGQMLHRCGDSIIRLLDLECAAIWSFNQRREVLELTGWAGALLPVLAERYEIRLGEGPIGRVAMGGPPLIVAAGDPLLAGLDRQGTAGLADFGAWPMTVEGRVIGVLAVGSKVSCSGATLASLTMVADSIAVGVERKQSEAELDLRAKRLSVVNDLSQRALAGGSLDELLVDAVSIVAGALEVEFCKVLELLPAGDLLLLRAGVGWRDGLVGHAQVPAGVDSQAGYTLTSGEPVVVWDLRGETRFSGPALLREHDVVSGISVVIGGREKPYGVMGAHTPRQRKFADDDVRFLQGVANVLAQAIQRKQAETELDERVRLASLAADVGIALNRTDTLREVLQQCSEVLVGHLDAAVARIWTLNEQQQVLELQASAGLYTHIDGGHARVRVGKFKIGLIAQDRKPHLTNEVVGDLRVGDQEWAKREGMVAFAGYPLISGDRLVGVMALFAKRKLSEATLNSLAAVSEAIAMGISRCSVVEELRVSQERFELAVRGSSDGLWDWNLISDEVYYAPRLKEMLGYSEHEDLEPRFSQFATRFHPDERDDVFQAIQEHYEQRTVLDVACRMRTKANDYRWFRSRGQAIWDENGKPVRMAGSLSDITDQIVADCRRNVRLAVTQTLAHASSIGEAAGRILQAICEGLDWDMGSLWMLDRDAHVLQCMTSWNLPGRKIDRFNAVTHQIAFERGEGVPGRVWNSRQPAWIPDVSSDATFLRAAVAAEEGLHCGFFCPILFESEVLGVIEFYSHEARDRDEDLLEMIATVSGQIGQFMERKQAERQLRNAHAETQQLLTSISSVLIGLDNEMRITKWNSAAEALFGVAAAHALGKSLAQCAIAWRTNDVPEQIARYRDADEAARIEELWFKDPSGRDHALGLTVNPIKTDDGASAGLLLLGADITEQKLLESQLRQAQKLESIGHLAAGIAHEINTPIQFIGDNTRFVQDSFGRLAALLAEYDTTLEAAKTGPLTPEQCARTVAAKQEADIEYLTEEIPSALSQSLEGLDRVASIVRAMKEFSHPGTEVKTPTDINRGIESTVMVARNEWKYVAEVVMDLDPHLPLVPCLPGDLNQVILNLIINATHAVADACKSRGEERGTISVSTHAQGEWVEIRVADSGTGIPEEIRDRVFDPFFTTKKVGKGTGQGLAIAYSVIVEKHGGSIDFETESGRGTTFVVRLPTLCDAPLEESAPC